MNCVSYYQQNVNKLFYDNEARLRSGWRALAFLFSYLFVSGLFIKAFILFRGEADTEKPADLLSLAIPYTIATLIAVILGWGYGRWFESVGLDAVGVALSGRSLRNLALGLGIGALAIGFAVLVAVATSSMSLTLNRGSAGSAISYNLATTLVVFVTGAASEETLFRGYPLQTFVRSKGTVVGVVLTSLLFAFAHNVNPSVSPLALANTFIAGIWFAAAYLKTRDLWFPFGIHFAWNWLQGPIFGINVSGIGDFSPDPLMRATDAGPAWLTGGAYGIEGGVACTFALMLSLALIYFLPMSATGHTEALK